MIKDFYTIFEQKKNKYTRSVSFGFMEETSM